MYVYCLTARPSGHFYIGSTFDPDKRVNRHIKELIHNKHHNSILQKLYNDGKIEYFDISEILTESREDAYELEDKYIKQFCSNTLCVNIGNSARGGDNLTHNPNKKDIIDRRTVTQKRKLSEMSPEERKSKYAKFGERNGMYGKTHTPEVRKLISDLFKGRPSPFKGVKLDKNSLQYKNFMEAVKKRDISGEKNPFFGKKHPPEILNKIRETRRKTTSAPDYINPSSKQVSINGVIYKSVGHAAKVLNMNYNTLAWRCRATKENYKDWFYL